MRLGYLARLMLHRSILTLRAARVRGEAVFSPPACALAASALLALAWSAPVRAEPLPLPNVDFALTARTFRGSTMNLAQSQGKMRVEMTRPNATNTVVGIIDLKARKMLMMMPNFPKMAVEIDLPPEVAVAAMTGTGTKTGQASVAGETCDLWQVDQHKIGPTTACITADGIALRTQIEIQGEPRTVYEALTLTRGPQKPELFQLPAGVQVVKLSKNKLGGLLGLPTPGGE